MSLIDIGILERETDNDNIKICAKYNNQLTIAKYVKSLQKLKCTF